MGNRWGNSVRLCFFWAPKIPADGDCSHEIKRRLLLGIKVMTNLDCLVETLDSLVETLDSLLKSRDITLPTKVRLVKAIIFTVVVYGY